MPRKTALIAGALGVIGRALVERLDADPEWEVIALSRRAPDFETGARFVPVDLLDRAATEAALGGMSGVTHLFHTAFVPRPTFAEEIAPNMAMLTNLVETVEAAAPGLAHIHLMEGAKWYGVQFRGPVRTPQREDDPRHMPPNFYYDQEDWLAERQKTRDWTWSALRPHGVWGFSTGSAMNLMTSLAVFATISKHYGMPLRWPGAPALFDCVYQLCDVRILGEAMEWCATTPAAANRAFNITNGDLTRWRHLWPRIADFFGLEEGPMQPLNLTATMADKEPVWAEIVARHGLRPYTLADLATWPFLDYALNNPHDQMSSLNRIRKAGWTSLLDTEETVTDQFARLREARIVP